MQGMRGANRVRSELCPESRQEFLHAFWPLRKWRHTILSFACLDEFRN